MDYLIGSILVANAVLCIIVSPLIKYCYVRYKMPLIDHEMEIEQVFTNLVDANTKIADYNKLIVDQRKCQDCPFGVGNPIITKPPNTASGIFMKLMPVFGILCPKHQNLGRWDTIGGMFDTDSVSGRSEVVKYIKLRRSYIKNLQLYEAFNWGLGPLIEMTGDAAPKFEHPFQKYIED